MSSPVRNVLSPKDSNSRSNSPVKGMWQRMSMDSESPFVTCGKLTSARRGAAGRLERSPRKAGGGKTLGFTIFHDSEYLRDSMDDQLGGDVDVMGKENEYIHKPRAAANKLSHEDQENVLQPRIKRQNFEHRRDSGPRKPLLPLSIELFPGHIKRSASGALEQLTELYIPPNFRNEQRTTHKHNKSLPCFITPPRGTQRQDYITKKFLVDSQIEEEPFNEDDEMESMLSAKLQHIRRRSKSVGVNSLKHHLINKTKFLILSN